MKKYIIKPFYTIFIIAVLGAPFLTSASARQFLISWKAETYAPPWYDGKILPTRGSAVQVYFELLENGKLVNLSGNKIRWYVADKLLKNENNGLGIKSIRFFVPDNAASDVVIRISIAEWPAGPLDYVFRIPVASPEAVINAPYAYREVGLGISSFEAIPFFFNTTDKNNLNFNWSLNNRSVDAGADSPWFLDLDIDDISVLGPDKTISLGAVIENVLNRLESAAANLVIGIK